GLNSPFNNMLINSTLNDNEIALTFAGITDQNNISKNWFENNNYSIEFIGTANENNISENYFRINSHGIRFHQLGNENNICNNTIIKTIFYGLYLNTSTANSTIQWNTFIGNNKDFGTHIYDNGSLNHIIYNYYDDWAAPDDNLDGYVDFPYMIDGEIGNFDPLPLADPVTIVYEHYLTKVKVLYPNGGESFNDSVLIQWTEAIDSWDYNVSYTLYYSSNGGST
ncbi:unnamed protein product, partial [marine sediment metagenome]